MKTFFLVFLLLFTWGWRQDREREIIMTDPDRVRLELALDPSAILIDTRVHFQFRRRRIENAINLPGKADLDRFATNTPKHRPLYLYCSAEARSAQAASLLNSYGFLEIHVMEGGFNRWKAYGLPTVKGKKGYPVKKRK